MNDVISSWLGEETGHNMSEISIRWGLTLLHFLWQAAIIGLLALFAARLLRSQSASVRYWLNAAALLACPICVAWTFAVVNVPASWRVVSNQQSHELKVYARRDAEGRFESHVFPGRVGYSSLSTPVGYVHAWNLDLDYNAKQEGLYRQRVVVPGDTSNFELPPLGFIRAQEICGKLVDADGNHVAKTGIYAQSVGE